MHFCEDMNMEPSLKVSLSSCSTLSAPHLGSRVTIVSSAEVAMFLLGRSAQSFEGIGGERGFNNRFQIPSEQLAKDYR